MQVSEQIDALYSLGRDPVPVLAAPRILAGIVVMPAAGGHRQRRGRVRGHGRRPGHGGPRATSRFLYGARLFWHSYDMFYSLMKAAAFGFIIPLISVHMGLLTRGGAEGVGRATTASVVFMIIAVLVLGRDVPAALPQLAMIEYRDIYKAFDVPVLAGVTSPCETGETLAIVGPRARQERAPEDDHRPHRPRPGRRAHRRRVGGAAPLGTTLQAIRRKVGYVFQNAALFDSMNVYENVAHGPAATRSSRRSASRRSCAGCARSLEDVNLDPSQVLRQAALRAVGRHAQARGPGPRHRGPAGDPALRRAGDRPRPRQHRRRRPADQGHRAERRDVTSIVVTHDIEGALDISDRIALLEGGKLRFVGTPEEFRRSQDPLVRAFADRKAAAAAAAQDHGGTSERRQAPPRPRRSARPRPRGAGRPLRDRGHRGHLTALFILTDAAIFRGRYIITTHVPDAGGHPPGRPRADAGREHRAGAALQDRHRTRRGHPPGDRGGVQGPHGLPRGDQVRQAPRRHGGRHRPGPVDELLRGGETMPGEQVAGCSTRRRRLRHRPTRPWHGSRRCFRRTTVKSIESGSAELNGLLKELRR